VIELMGRLMELMGGDGAGGGVVEVMEGCWK